MNLGCLAQNNNARNTTTETTNARQNSNVVLAASKGHVERIIKTFLLILISKAAAR